MQVNPGVPVEVGSGTAVLGRPLHHLAHKPYKELVTVALRLSLRRVERAGIKGAYVDVVSIVSPEHKRSARTIEKELGTQAAVRHEVCRRRAEEGNDAGEMGAAAVGLVLGVPAGEYVATFEYIPDLSSTVSMSSGIGGRRKCCGLPNTLCSKYYWCSPTAP